MGDLILHTVSEAHGFLVQLLFSLLLQLLLDCGQHEKLPFFLGVPVPLCSTLPVTPAQPHSTTCLYFPHLESLFPSLTTVPQSNWDYLEIFWADASAHQVSQLIFYGTRGHLPSGMPLWGHQKCWAVNANCDNSQVDSVMWTEDQKAETETVKLISLVLYGWLAWLARWALGPSDVVFLLCALFLLELAEHFLDQKKFFTFGTDSQRAQSCKHLHTSTTLLTCIAPLAFLEQLR